MTKELLIGIAGVGVLHTDQEVPDVDTKFKMATEAGFDYYERSPPPPELEAHLEAAEQCDLPIRSTGCFYPWGPDEAHFARNLSIAGQIGARTHNVRILTNHADGHKLTDDEIAGIYMWAFERGDHYGVMPCFEC